MKSIGGKDIAEIVGITAIVASLIFVGLQMKQTQEIAAFESLSDGADRTMVYRALIAENADAWSKACKGEALTDTERLRFASVYEAFLNNTFTGWARARQDQYSIIDGSVFVRRIALNYYRFPGLAKFQATRKDWLGPGGVFQTEIVKEYRALVATELARLAEQGDQVEFDVSMCGL